MKTQFNPTETAGTPALKSMAQFARELDRTTVTLWRWRQDKWIDPADVLNMKS